MVIKKLQAKPKRSFRAKTPRQHLQELRRQLRKLSRELKAAQLAAAAAERRVSVGRPRDPRPMPVITTDLAPQLAARATALVTELAALTEQLEFLPGRGR